MELLSCPFCNGTDIKFEVIESPRRLGGAYLVEIFCGSCDVSLREWGSSVDEAKNYLSTKWNTRSSSYE